MKDRAPSVVFRSRFQKVRVRHLPRSDLNRSPAHRDKTAMNEAQLPKANGDPAALTNKAHAS